MLFAWIKLIDSLVPKNVLVDINWFTQLSWWSNVRSVKTSQLLCMPCGENCVIESNVRFFKFGSSRWISVCVRVCLCSRVLILSRNLIFNWIDARGNVQVSIDKSMLKQVRIGYRVSVLIESHVRLIALSQWMNKNERTKYVWWTKFAWMIPMLLTVLCMNACMCERKQIDWKALNQLINNCWFLSGMKVSVLAFRVKKASLSIYLCLLQVHHSWSLIFCILNQNQVDQRSSSIFRTFCLLPLHLH